AAPEPFLRAVAPFRDGLLVGCECVHPWYWLADTCRDHAIPFVLGHAWAMKAVHGSKTKCDRQDAEAIARLLKGGNFPPAYAYPRGGGGFAPPLPPRAAPGPPAAGAVRPRAPRPPPGQPAARLQRRQVQEQARRHHRRHRRPLRPTPRRDRPGPARPA